MIRLFSAFRTYLMDGFGRCATCMRQALAAALVAWALAALALWAAPGAMLAGLAGLAAAALTALWLAHVAVFAARREPAVSAGRRAALGLALRAAAVGVAVSIPVTTWSTRAMAFCGQCTKNKDCGPCCKCVNTAPVNSGKVCNECKPK